MDTKPIAVCFLLVVLLLPVHASADTPASEPVEPTASDLLKKAQSQYDKGAYDGALQSLEAALQLEEDPDPEAILLMGHCYRQLGNDEEALERYAAYQAAWEANHPTRRSPHAKEIAEHVEMLRQRIREREAAEAEARKRQEAAIRKQVEEAQRRMAETNARQREEAQRKARQQARQMKEQGERRQRRRRLFRIVAISGAALAASATFTGGVFHASANRAQDDQSFDSARRVSITGFVLAGVFGAAAATAAVLYLLTPRPGSKPGESDKPTDKPTASTATAVVSPTPGGAAVAASFRF